jgi:hypothetical protein
MQRKDPSARHGPHRGRPVRFAVQGYHVRLQAQELRELAKSLIRGRG